MNTRRSSSSTPNCFQCQNFYITYEPAHPYGCKGMGFKSARIPAEVVWHNSGTHCLRFIAKQQKKPES